MADLHDGLLENVSIIYDEYMRVPAFKQDIAIFI